MRNNRALRPNLSYRYGLAGIEAASKDVSPVFIVDQDYRPLGSVCVKVFVFKGRARRFLFSQPAGYRDRKRSRLTRKKQSRCTCICCCRSVRSYEGRELYELAQAGGIEDAKQRIEALK
jgi:hypothetical protein